jgi:hypothetical protein
MTDISTNIQVLGDGVNWGAKAALASRSAVYGATEYLNQALFAVSRLPLILSLSALFFVSYRFFWDSGKLSFIKDMNGTGIYTPHCSFCVPGGYIVPVTSYPPHLLRL